MSEEPKTIKESVGSLTLVYDSEYDIEVLRNYMTYVKGKDVTHVDFSVTTEYEGGCESITLEFTKQRPETQAEATERWEKEKVESRRFLKTNESIQNLAEEIKTGQKPTIYSPRDAMRVLFELHKIGVEAVSEVVTETFGDGSSVYIGCVFKAKKSDVKELIEDTKTPPK